MVSVSRSAHVDTFCRENLPPRDEWPVLEFTLPQLHYGDRINAAVELIDQAVVEFGAEKPCLLTPDGEVWSFADVQRRSNQIAQVLTEDLGLVSGNRVLLRSPNKPWLVVSWLGVLKAGCVAVTTMHVLHAREIAKLITLTRPAAGISDHRFMDDLRIASNGGMPLLTLGDASAHDLAIRSEAKSGRFEAVDTAAEDVAILAPTSGTTGTPKITMHFHRDILAAADTFARQVLKPTSEDIFSGSPPLAFTFGLGGLLIFPLRFGASSLLVERASPVELAELCHRHGVTVLFSAPTAYRAIVRKGKASLLRGVRLAVSSGEHLAADDWNEIHQATGLKLINALGSTEMLHAYVAAVGDAVHQGATGLAILGFRTKVLDESGNETRPNEVGRLAVIGPTGCRYLYGVGQKEHVRSGWNLTDDRFRRDDDGYLWYEGRVDGMIVSSGYNISALEVESALAAHPEVLECAVVGKPDTERGSVVCAFVVLRDGVAPNEVKRKELQTFIKGAIAPYKYPRELIFVSKLPRNASGKLQHYRLRHEGRMGSEIVGHAASSISGRKFLGSGA